MNSVAPPEQLLDLTEVEQAAPLGLFERPLQLPGPGNLGVIEECSREGGHGDAFVDAHVVGIELADAMEPDAVSGLATPLRHRHVNDRA